jgi:hypothetical protein
MRRTSNGRHTLQILAMAKKNRRQEAAEQIKRIMAEIKTDELSIGALSRGDLSALDSDDDIDVTADGLSAISDVSSVASFHLSPLKKKRKPGTGQKRPSRIPVPKGKSTALQPPASDGFRLAKAVRCPSPPPVQPRPANFLAPNLSDYTTVTLCIFEGTDFPRSRFGERSTYVVVHLHPELPVIKSPICFNRTNGAVYNGGFTLNCIGVDFSCVVPVIEVFDFISDEQSELIGLGYIQYHLARRCDDVCIVLQNEWVGIVTVNTRIRCGQVKMSLIFHNQDRDVAELVRGAASEASDSTSQSERMQQAPVRNGAALKLSVEDNPPVMRESLAVQAEVEPCYQRVDDEIGQIDELNLTFNAPMPIRLVPPTVPAAREQIREKPVKPPLAHAVCFIDESDLDENDEIVARCQVRRPVTPVAKTEQSAPESGRRLLPRPPVAQTNPSGEQKPGKPSPQETPLRTRFASYANYNWA